ncbi:hypothetical protein [Actinomyces urogenitalis]|uniref:hypothetical protein n=1 Tax=Actinomyces urogenitalis TaxID=103621 RepID=UPI002912990E|nr:hypothetical protein [Actinomyces urogenitalis]MDU5427380.1 hypothetical protein [Actinomyces urogenitalis]
MSADAEHRPDLSVSLPTDTLTFSVAGMLPVGRLEERHALILADDVSAEEVEALAVSQDAQAGWVGASRLQLLPGVELQGPWPLDGELRALMGLPEWAASLMILECEPERRGALPPELAGTDPVADAFPVAQPAGTELVALTRLQAIARRLAGALLLRADAPAGSAGGAGADGASARGAGAGSQSMSVLVQPDPDANVNLDVYAPVWLTPDACQAVLAGVLPGARSQLDPRLPEGLTGLAAIPQAELDRLTELLGADLLDQAWTAAREREEAAAALAAEAAQAGRTLEEVRTGYAVVAPVDEARPGWGHVEVQVEAAEYLPLAVAGEPWAVHGVVVHQIVWRPLELADRDPARLTRTRRGERAEAAALIEAAARALVEATGGRALDEDGFLVSL